VNNLIETVRTMDSREIAELTNKGHGHVCRDIQEMLGRLNGLNQSSFGSVYIAGNGEERHCYKLPYRETMILVSGYSVELRAKIVDRWMELERAALASSLPNFSDPVAAARAWADEVEAKRRAEGALADAQPKIEFFDQVADSKDAIPMRDAAAVLNIPGFGRNNLFDMLRKKEILDEKNIPYREYQDRGYFRVVERSWSDDRGESHITLTTLVYQKGLDYIRKILEAIG
jgi:anti-repressor protein